MFGYVIVNKDALDKEQLDRYRSVYCAVCSSIRDISGVKGTITLRYDLVLLALILGSVNETEQTIVKERCPVHPLTRSAMIRDRYTEYAAGAGILLDCLKLEDDIRDDGKNVDKAALALLRKGYDRAAALYPELTHTLEEKLREMSRLEEEKCRDADRMAGLFGEIMGALFTPDRGSIMNRYLYDFGMSLGRYLYMLDACLDLEEDIRKGRYNPLADTSHEDREWQKQAIALELGDVMASYRMLPVSRDSDLTDNIIYSGITSALPAELKIITGEFNEP